MKKPDYIEITLPCPKKYFNSAVKKYFKQLHTNTAELRFSTIRQRKVFGYKIVFSEATTYTDFSDNVILRYFKLQLQKKS
jgi:hypothetical protein